MRYIESFTWASVKHGDEIIQSVLSGAYWQQIIE